MLELQLTAESCLTRIHFQFSCEQDYADLSLDEVTLTCLNCDPEPNTVPCLEPQSPGPVVPPWDAQIDDPFVPFEGGIIGNGGFNEDEVNFWPWFQASSLAGEHAELGQSPTGYPNIYFQGRVESSEPLVYSQDLIAEEGSIFLLDFYYRFWGDTAIENECRISIDVQTQINFELWEWVSIVEVTADGQAYGRGKDGDSIPYWRRSPPTKFILYSNSNVPLPLRFVIYCSAGEPADAVGVDLDSFRAICMDCQSPPDLPSCPDAMYSVLVNGDFDRGVELTMPWYVSSSSETGVVAIIEPGSGFSGKPGYLRLDLNRMTAPFTFGQELAVDPMQTYKLSYAHLWDMATLGGCVLTVTIRDDHSGDPVMSSWSEAGSGSWALVDRIVVFTSCNGRLTLDIACRDPRADGYLLLDAISLTCVSCGDEPEVPDDDDNDDDDDDDDDDANSGSGPSDTRTTEYQLPTDASAFSAASDASTASSTHIVSEITRTSLSSTLATDAASTIIDNAVTSTSAEQSLTRLDPSVVSSSLTQSSSSMTSSIAEGGVSPLGSGILPITRSTTSMMPSITDSMTSPSTTIGKITGQLTTPTMRASSVSTSLSHPPNSSLSCTGISASPNTTYLASNNQTIYGVACGEDHPNFDIAVNGSFLKPNNTSALLPRALTSTLFSGTNSAEICIELCEDIFGCVAVVWYVDTQECFLKWDMGPATPRAGAIFANILTENPPTATGRSTTHTGRVSISNTRGETSSRITTGVHETVTSRLCPPAVTTSITVCYYNGVIIPLPTLDSP